MMEHAQQARGHKAQRLRDPLLRMSVERRIALLVFNALLLAAALTQLFGLGMQDRSQPVIQEQSPALMEFEE